MDDGNVLMKVFVHELHECFEFFLDKNVIDVFKIDPSCTLEVINGFLRDAGRPTLGTCTVTFLNEIVPAVAVEEQTIPEKEQYVDEEVTESPASIVFSKTATTYLITAYVERRERFDQGNISKVKLFEEISNEMKRRHISSASGAQCNTKWTSLKRTYTRIKDANNKSGNGNNTWEFYKDMDEAVGRRPENEPVATLSSTGSNVAAPTSGSDDKCNSPEPPSKRRKKEDAAERKEAARQKRHEDSMALKRKALETLNAILASVNSKKN